MVMQNNSSIDNPNRYNAFSTEVHRDAVAPIYEVFIVLCVEFAVL